MDRLTAKQQFALEQIVATYHDDDNVDHVLTQSWTGCSVEGLYGINNKTAESLRLRGLVAFSHHRDPGGYHWFAVPTAKGLRRVAEKGATLGRRSEGR